MTDAHSNLGRRPRTLTLPLVATVWLLASAAWVAAEPDPDCVVQDPEFGICLGAPASELPDGALTVPRPSGDERAVYHQWSLANGELTARAVDGRVRQLRRSYLAAKRERAEELASQFDAAYGPADPELGKQPPQSTKVDVFEVVRHPKSQLFKVWQTDTFEARLVFTNGVMGWSYRLLDPDD